MTKERGLVEMNVEILQQKGHNFLWIDDHLWMYDIPAERKAQKDISNKAFGDVLVAGYGLGILQRFLSENKKVKSITTIEISEEVVNKVKDIYGKIHGDIIIENFYDFHTNNKFNCVIGDIWEEITPGALEDYKKFKNKAKRLLKKNGKILGWGKEFFEYLINKEKIK